LQIADWNRARQQRKLRELIGGQAEVADRLAIVGFDCKLRRPELLRVGGERNRQHQGGESEARDHAQAPSSIHGGGRRNFDWVPASPSALINARNLAVSFLM